MHDRVKGIVRYFLVTVVALFLILGCIILYAGVQKATLKKRRRGVRQRYMRRELRLF